MSKSVTAMYLFSGLFLFVTRLHAQESFEKLLPAHYEAATVHASTTCQLGKINFTLNLGDDNKEPDPERKEFGYPYFWVVTAKGRSVSALPPKEYNEFLFLAPSERSLCKDTQAFLRPDGGVAIFVKQNNRPNADNLSVVFYNPKRGQVVAFARNIGHSSKIESAGKQIFFRIKDLPSDMASFNVTVHGKKSETTEDVFEYWNKVSRRNDQVIVVVDPDMTWKRSPFHSYFKSKDAFQKAFDWSAADKKFGYRWVYRISSPDCIHVSSTRFTDNKNWICR